jgi:hypothetical protein
MTNAAKIIGTEKTLEIINNSILGKRADKTSKLSLAHYATSYRQDIIFRKMKQIAEILFEIKTSDMLSLFAILAHQVIHLY